MIIYLCIKFQSNTQILSKDIARKPKVLRTGRTGWDGRDDERDGQRWYYMPTPTENGGGIKNSLEPPKRPCKPQFYCIKVGFKGVNL